MSKRAAITGQKMLMGGLLCLLLAACSAPQAELTEDDISPIDYNKMQAFNVWLEEQKKLEPSNAFKAKPMQVSGKGRVRAVPDIAVIAGVIISEADQDDTAIDAAAKIINAVQAAVKTQNVELNFTQIQTTEKRDNGCLARNQKALAHHSVIISDNQYNANIKRRLEQGLDIKIKPRKAKPRLDTEVCPVTHIEANLRFTARVKPAHEAGNIINDFTAAGVNKVDLFGYDFSDYDALYKEASTKAVKDAKLKAERVAKIAGTTLTEIVSFHVDGPQRTKRVGEQAMIITSHQNRNTGVQGSAGFQDRVVTSGNSGFRTTSAPTRGQFTVFNGVSNQVVQSTETIVNQTGEILCRVQIPAQYKTITRNGKTERILVAPAREEWKPESEALNAGSLNANSTNALKMSLQAGQRTITVNAYLGYRYETPIDGSVVPQNIN